MKTVTALTLGAVAVSGSMLAASRAPVAPGSSSLLEAAPGVSAAAQNAPAAVAFTHVNVVPMDSERVLRDQTVLVEQGRIRLLGSASEVTVPAGITTVDGSGKYLMPGLAEMHGHMPGGEVEEMVMFLYVANGVTTVRGMLGQDGHMELRRKANAGEIVAPTLYMAGPSFSGGSVSSPEQAARKVRTQKEQGWDLLKIHPGLTVPEYDAMAITAHEVGLRFGGHVPADVGLEHAIEMGQETFDHLDGFIEYLNAFDEPIDRGSLDELVTMVKNAGSWVVPTLVLWDVGIIGRGDPQALANYPEMRYWPRRNIPGVVEGVEGWIRRHAGAARQAQADPRAADLWANNRLEVLKALSDAGAGILMGTDSPQIFSVPGFSLHREMQAMAEAGMSPYEILVSGTRAVGEYFRRSDTFGTVAVGRRADLILLNTNPLDDIANVTDRAGVMVRGRWFSEGYIQERLEEIARRSAAD
jgi:imidazolonepropionase-like amidohydrolase